jgi:hypothetical protein
MKLQKCTIAICPTIAIIRPDILAMLKYLDPKCNPVKDETGAEAGAKCELYFKARFSKRELKEMRAKEYPEGLYIRWCNTFDTPCLVQDGHDPSYAVYLYSFEEIEHAVSEIAEEVKQFNQINMKRFVIVRHENAIENVIIPINCSEAFNNVFFKMFLEGLRRELYDIEIVDSLSLSMLGSDYKIYDTAENIEALVETIKTVKLYERVVKPVIAIDTKAEVKEFKMSSCFVIKDVSRSSMCTFFKVKKDPESIKDIIFDDTSLKKALECKVSRNNYYYMHGNWHFYRSISNPTLWEARLWKEEVVDYVKEIREITL